MPPPILYILLLSIGILSAQTTNPSSPHQNPITIHVTEPKTNSELPPGFLGLSYESSMLLPKGGNYYFDATNAPLVTLFQSLGIKNLRVGANAVDDPRVPVPDEKDIDALFGFAKAAGVKVIYSFRLKNGDPSRSAQLAKYIQDHYGDLLDTFAIGNEPDCFDGIRKNKDGYKVFYALWKPHYDAIIQAVPKAQIEGPSAAFNGPFAINLAKDLHASGHLPMVSSHYYVFGAGANAERDPAGTQERLLSESNSVRYEKLYQSLQKPLADLGVPYRIDEMNSCYNGGAKGSSDTYASALWSLDWDHWWAAHGITGLNYHTGESVGMNGGFHAPNYASFVHMPDGKGFDVHPIAYSHLAFSQGAKGHILETQTEGNANLTSYAYQDGSVYLITLINKDHGSQGGSVPVSITLPEGAGSGSWERLDLNQKNGDIAAKSDIALGDSSISPDGIWSAHWQPLPGTAVGTISVNMQPASATILRFTRQQTN